MKVGHLIRAERIRQKIKQVVLARGICTPSYLSKIERNLIAPSEEVVTLLFNKLNIDVDMLQEHDPKSEVEFEKLLRESYKEVITKRDRKFTEQKLHYLEKQSPFFENQSLYFSYQLIILRFQLIMGNNLEACKNKIEDLSQMVEDFSPPQSYLLKVNSALYYYTTKKHKRAIEYLEDVLSMLDTINLEDWERAELYYMLGVIYTADSRIFQSIDYIKKALEFFREHFFMKRVVECYVVIGVTQKISEQFQDALESYFKAKQLCDEFNLDSEKGLVYHNLGSLYGTMGNSKESISHLKKSIKYKKDQKSQLISILGIVIEYSKANEKKLVTEWCEKGISLYYNLEDKSLTSYYHHFVFFNSLHSEQGLSEIIAKQTIEYFKILQDYQHVNKYCIALAEWYFNNRKYKLSSIYYNEANRYGYIYRKNIKWEDL